MNYKRWYARPLMRANKMLASRVRSSKWLTRLLFKLDVEPGKRPQFWDYTTLVLQKALDQYARPGMRTLEIGPGENAVLTLYLAKKLDVSAHCVELEAHVAEHAMETAKRNRLQADIRQGDMFKPCEGRFDLIFWNPPYVPADAPAEGLIGEQSATESDGGSDGLDLIRRFLAEAPEYMNDDALLLLGYSSFYVSHEDITQMITGNGMQILGTVDRKPFPSRVIVAGKTTV